MPNIRQIVGHNIRLYRNARGITQEALAEILDVSGSYIGYLERGVKSPSLELLDNIARVLKVEPAALLTSTDNTPNPELSRLIAILSDKGPNVHRFINEVATAYFKSLGKI